MAIRLLHILVAFNLLASSVGIVVSKHYCGGEWKHTAFFREAESCHQPAKAIKCPMHSGEDGIPDNCCQNDMERYVDDEGYLSTVTPELPEIPTFLVSLPLPYLALFTTDPHFKPKLLLPPKIPLAQESSIECCRRLERWLC